MQEVSLSLHDLLRSFDYQFGYYESIFWVQKVPVSAAVTDSNIIINVLRKSNSLTALPEQKNPAAVILAGFLSLERLSE